MLLTVPEDKPEGLTVDESSITDTEALLRFNAIDESPERIHGFFRGYRVRTNLDVQTDKSDPRFTYMYVLNLCGMWTDEP